MNTETGTKMDDERLKEIKSRLEKVTRAPWWVEPNNGRRDAIIAFGERGDLSETYDLIENYNLADYDFMAHSRQDIPDLLAHIESLSAQLTAATARVKELEAERAKSEIEIVKRFLNDAQSEYFERNDGFTSACRRTLEVWAALPKPPEAK